MSVVPALALGQHSDLYIKSLQQTVELLTRIREEGYKKGVGAGAGAQRRRGAALGARFSKIQNLAWWPTPKPSTGSTRRRAHC